MLNINPTLLGSVVGVGLACSVILHEPSPAHAEAAEAAWVVPDVDKLPNDDWGRAVRYGRDLIVKTADLIGPEVSDPAHRFSGNNMNCQNCHLEGEVGTIEDRVQGCMERSMNGRRLPPDSREMTSIVAYLRFLSTGRPVGAPTVGRGVGRISELTRAADPAHGRSIYVQTCSACHGEKGQGQRVGNVGDAQGYSIPPLWGPDSFNDGAGMTRLTNAANFVHSNMPNGATWQQPALSPADAWDVAAFIDAQPRPHKSDLENDYPKRLEKPIDTPYGPYADSVAAAEHKLGPFQPIRDAVKSSAASPAQTQSAP
jgi:thiosulfate dehydrogenase